MFQIKALYDLKERFDTDVTIDKNRGMVFFNETKDDISADLMFIIESFKMLSWVYMMKNRQSSSRTLFNGITGIILMTKKTCVNTQAMLI